MWLITSWPQYQLGLNINLRLSQKASTSTKLDILGVKLQVNEVEKVNFHVNFEKYSLKSPAQVRTDLGEFSKYLKSQIVKKKLFFCGGLQWSYLCQNKSM